MDEKNHVGPLIDKAAVADFTNALELVKKEGGKILYGGEVLKGKGYESECYVKPAIVEAKNQLQNCSGRNFCSNFIFN